MVAPAWLARLLQVEGEIEEEELAGRLAQRLRLQVPTGREGVQVLTRFVLLGESLHRRPEELVQSSLPESPAEAQAAAAQLGLRGGADLERVLRLAARELWAWLAAQPPEPEKKRRPSSPRNRAPEGAGPDERLAAFAAEAIAEAKGRAPSPPAAAPGPPAAPTAASSEGRLEALAAQAIADARRQAPGSESSPASGRPEPPASTVPPAAAPAAPRPAPSGPPGVAAPTPPAAPQTFGEQLQAAGPLIVFLATVGAGTIVALIVWLVGGLVGAFGGGV